MESSLVTLDEQCSFFPSSWYRIEHSHKVTAARIHTIHYFGKPFICVRGKDQAVRVFDAHCPHLGAHLGVGGKIKNDQIICPFHRWHFNLQGQCAHIPYCEKIPKRANLNSYPVTEKAGSIYFFYPHHDIETLRNFPLDSLPNWQYYGGTAELFHHQLSETLAKVFHEFQLNVLNAGILIFSSQSELFKILLTTTPIDASRSRIVVSYILANPWNIFLAWKIKKIIRNKIASLVSTNGINK